MLLVDFHQGVHAVFLQLLVDMFSIVVDIKMFRVVIVYILAVAASTVICETDFKYDEGVLVLTKQTFPDAINEFEFILVEFCKYESLLCFYDLYASSPVQ